MYMLNITFGFLRVLRWVDAIHINIIIINRLTFCSKHSVPSISIPEIQKWNAEASTIEF